MIDSPRRPSPRFPPGNADRIAKVVADQLDRWDARVGVGSLASGADLIIAEQLIKRRAELRIMLPMNVEEFLNESIRPSGDPRWEKRFHAVRKHVEREGSDRFEVIGDDFPKHSPSPFLFTGLLFDGTAQLLARERDLPAHTLAIWDGAKGDGPGGTATFVAHAVHRGRDVLTIHPQTLRRVCPTRKHVVSTRNFKWSKFGAGEFVLEHRLLAFLFADAKGFSAMRETQVPAFARVVLHLVKRAMPRVPLVLNTWGDGIFIVTHKPRDCAEIAVRLLEAAQSVDPRIEGLPGALTFRIGIHAGPAYFTGCDPVTGRPNAYGRDVSLAARIEPVVDPPGQIWASAAFVRLAEATGIDGFQFKRLPPVTLAKGAGKLELHQLTRRAGGSSGATPLK